MKGKSKIALVILLAAVILVGLNVILVEHGKIAAEREAREEERLKREMLEEIKLEEAREVVEYYLEFEPARDEFIKETIELSEEMESEFVNIDRIKELVSRRLDAAIAFRDKFLMIESVPSPLETFHDYELEFIKSDIETIGLVLSYYDSESYSTYNSSILNELYLKTGLLYQRAEEELYNVCRQYEMRYLFE